MLTTAYWEFVLIYMHIITPFQLFTHDTSLKNVSLFDLLTALVTGILSVFPTTRLMGDKERVLETFQLRNLMRVIRSK